MPPQTINPQRPLGCKTNLGLYHIENTYNFSTTLDISPICPIKSKNPMVPSQAQSPDPQGEGDREGCALDWLALKLSPGLGTRLAARLAVAFGDPRAVFQASPGALEQHGVPPLVARMLASSPAYEEAQRELD